MQITIRTLKMTQIDIVGIGKQLTTTYALLNSALGMLPQKYNTFRNALLITTVLLLGILFLELGTVLLVALKIMGIAIVGAVVLTLLYFLVRWLDQQFQALIEWWITLWDSEQTTYQEHPLIAKKRQCVSQKHRFLV